MSDIELLGFGCALMVGLALGLIGGGGSILAVPIFAYLFELDPVTSTAYSLFVVGAIALFGGIHNARKGFVDWKIVCSFGIPAVFGVWLMRRIFIPALPDELLHIQHFVVTKRMMMFGLFAILMALSAISMLHDSRSQNIKPKQPISTAVLIMQGLMLGFITGFVGAGGGFLIIPALILMAGLDVRTAIGTSLVIIALNSLLGFFLGDAMHLHIDWPFLLIFVSIALLGMAIGTQISKKLDASQLKKGFAYFIVFMALFVFYMEFLRPS